MSDVKPYYGKLRECGHDRGGCQCCQDYAIEADTPFAVTLNEPSHGSDYGAEFSLQTAKANARELSRRWNSEPELREAVQRLLDVVRYTITKDGTTVADGWPEDVAFAKAALTTPTQPETKGETHA